MGLDCLQIYLPLESRTENVFYSLSVLDTPSKCLATQCLVYMRPSINVCWIELHCIEHNWALKTWQGLNQVGRREDKGIKRGLPLTHCGTNPAGPEERWEVGQDSEEAQSS